MLGTGLWLRPCDHQLRASAAIGWARALGGLGGWEKAKTFQVTNSHSLDKDSEKRVSHKKIEKP